MAPVKGSQYNLGSELLSYFCEAQYQSNFDFFGKLFADLF